MRKKGFDKCDCNSDEREVAHKLELKINVFVLSIGIFHISCVLFSFILITNETKEGTA